MRIKKDVVHRIKDFIEDSCNDISNPRTTILYTHTHIVNNIEIKEYLNYQLEGS